MTATLISPNGAAPKSTDEPTRGYWLTLGAAGKELGISDTQLHRLRNIGVLLENVHYVSNQPSPYPRGPRRITLWNTSAIHQIMSQASIKPWTRQDGKAPRPYKPRPAARKPRATQRKLDDARLEGRIEMFDQLLEQVRSWEYGTHSTNEILEALEACNPKPQPATVTVKGKTVALTPELERKLDRLLKLKD